MGIPERLMGQGGWERALHDLGKENLFQLRSVNET